MREESIEKMNFKELRTEVQRLRDELAIFKRKFEDVINNLDNDNMADSIIKEKNGMKAEIKVNAEEIETKVSEEDVDNKLTNYSTITQTADKISTSVARIFTGIERVTSTSAMTDTTKIYSYDGDNYYYDGSSWVATSDDSIASSFVQTANGFELNGNVKVSGDLISGGTITGVALKTSNENYIDIGTNAWGWGNIAFFKGSGANKTLVGQILVSPANDTVNIGSGNLTNMIQISNNGIEFIGNVNIYPKFA